MSWAEVKVLEDKITSDRLENSDVDSNRRYYTPYPVFLEMKRARGNAVPYITTKHKTKQLCDNTNLGISLGGLAYFCCEKDGEIFIPLSSELRKFDGDTVTTVMTDTIMSTSQIYPALSRLILKNDGKLHCYSDDDLGTNFGYIIDLEEGTKTLASSHVINFWSYLNLTSGVATWTAIMGSCYKEDEDAIYMLIGGGTQAKSGSTTYSYTSYSVIKINADDTVTLIYQGTAETTSSTNNAADQLYCGLYSIGYQMYSNAGGGTKSHNNCFMHNNIMYMTYGWSRGSNTNDKILGYMAACDIDRHAIECFYPAKDAISGLPYIETNQRFTAGRFSKLFYKDGFAYLVCPRTWQDSSTWGDAIGVSIKMHPDEICTFLSTYSFKDSHAYDLSFDLLPVLPNEPNTYNTKETYDRFLLSAPLKNMDADTIQEFFGEAYVDSREIKYKKGGN